jgi:site-specific DNA-methyltransferase (adenine-specific)
LNDLSIPDILTARRILKGYPTEKPVELSEILLSQSTKVNELVVDPFMGSGSVGIAAIKMGRKFLGNDIQTLSVKSSTVRLSLVKEQSAWKDMLMPIG